MKLLNTVDNHVQGLQRGSQTTQATASMALNVTEQMNGVLTRVAEDVTRSHALLASFTLIHSLDPTREKPVHFEDSFGTIHELPMSFLNDWDVGIQKHVRPKSNC